MDFDDATSRTSAATPTSPERRQDRRQEQRQEWVILVDERDREIGTTEKLAAHCDGGQLHRAFSVFLFDERDRMLLQRRASVKYHFPLLWTNSCCGHPRPGEDVLAAATRRVREELGVEAELVPAFSFVYRATDRSTQLTEHEIDHVFLGRLGGEPDPCPSEIDSIAWWETADLVRDLEENPARYTPWFRRAVAELLDRALLTGASS